MGLLDRFRKPTKAPDVDPIADLVLAKLKVGYLLDYDLRTWQVTDYARYRFNDGSEAEEWELTAERDKRYLELGQGGAWTLSKNIPVGAVEGDVRKHIIDHDDPPDKVTYKGTVYYLEGSSGGDLFPGGDGPGRELIQWEFLDEDEENFVSIVQWSETEITAVHGIFVEDYQFTDILPGELA